jgi:hypothetical protein
VKLRQNDKIKEKKNRETKRQRDKRQNITIWQNNRKKIDFVLQALLNGITDNVISLGKSNFLQLVSFSGKWGVRTMISISERKLSVSVSVSAVLKYFGIGRHFGAYPCRNFGTLSF